MLTWTDHTIYTKAIVGPFKLYVVEGVFRQAASKADWSAYIDVVVAPDDDWIDFWSARGFKSLEDAKVGAERRLVWSLQEASRDLERVKWRQKKSKLYRRGRQADFGSFQLRAHPTDSGYLAELWIVDHDLCLYMLRVKAYDSLEEAMRGAEDLLRDLIRETLEVVNGRGDLALGETK